MDEVITFDKSLQQRYQDYSEVLSSHYDVLPSSRLLKQWAFHLEMVVDKIGWQAIWKLPRLTCESLHIHFPSVVLVFVLDVNVQELKALVRVLAVQDDISIPDKHWVPLIQLWPTKDQDESIVLNLLETAAALDMLRFFYLYLYMPWDRDDDDSQDWMEKHLESRLHFYYDLKNGTIPREVGEHIHSLLTEARRLQSKRDVLEAQISGGDSDVEFEKDTTDSKITRSLTEIHVRMLEIQSQIEILENPIFRQVYIERHFKEEYVKPKTQPNIWLISGKGSPQNHIRFLEQIANCYPSASMNFSTSLAKLLDTSNSEDVYLLNENKHTIRLTGALEKGGHLRGIGTNRKIILTSTIEDIMLDFKADNVVLENVTLDTATAQCGMLVRKGKCVLKNCRILGNGRSSTQQGIIVLSGAQLELDGCEVSQYAMGIVGNSNSKIVLTNCDLHHNTLGVKIFDDCIVEMTSTVIRECAASGFLLDSVKSENAVGDFDVLKFIPSVQYANITGTNNAGGDVVIMQKQKLKPVEDLFSNPDLDPTIIESDVSIEDHENTVLER